MTLRTQRILRILILLCLASVKAFAPNVRPKFSLAAASPTQSQQLLLPTTTTALSVATQDESLELERRERTQRINDLALINAVAISFLGVGAAYSLLHTHVEALWALWEYDLGAHAPGLTKAAVAMDVLCRYPMDMIQAYSRLVPENPIFYKACTSGVAYGLGDFISQVYQGKTLSNLDLPRSFRSAAAGFIGHGPLCHYWLLTMETYLDFDGAWWATGLKVTADLTVWSLFLNAAYSFIIGTLALRKPQDVWQDVRATTWPALRSAWRFWPFVHTVSFSHAVPMDLKLLWVDVMEIVWVTILSKVANEDKNASLEKNQKVVDCQEDFGVMPELEIEMASTKELNKKLPQQVWEAAWPLVAMWPVLYAGYQLEHVLGLVD